MEGVEELHKDQHHQSGHAPRYGPEIKNGKSSVKNGEPESLKCGTIQEEVEEDNPRGLLFSASMCLSKGVAITLELPQGLVGWWRLSLIFRTRSTAQASSAD